MTMVRFFVLWSLGLFVGISWASAQEAAAEAEAEVPVEAEAPAADEPPPETPPADRRVTELQTADYYELTTRARELGLAVTGSATELRQRIAQALGLTLPTEVAPGGQILTVDSAQEAGLLTVEAPGDGKLLRLSGGLQVTLVDQDKKVTHVIEADELWYDQANEEMTARGQVVYTMIRESSKEVFRGDSLTFRLSDSQGIFYGGASDRTRTVSDQTLTFRYQGNAIRRSAEDMVILDTGTITSSLGSDPYYRIMAKKIWVLAPGEWGLQDAVLYLGRIPVLYFPFFFQPGDDFFFNPVLSFPDAGDRRGTSLQTTTYVWGKKKRDSSPLSFLQLEDAKTEDSERVLRGLFLVRGKQAVTDIPHTWVWKFMADFYSNLGFLTGFELSTPGAGGFKTLNLSGGIGLTRTVNTEGIPFSVNPFQAALDPWDQSDWNGSWLGDWRLPVRWGGTAALDTGWGSLSLEYYSDPLLYADLTGSRSENFSIFSLLGMGPAKKTVTATAKSSLNWTAALNAAPLTVNSSLLWDSKTVPTASQGPTGDPENTFYLPTQMVLPQMTLNLSGTLWPPASTPAGTSSAPTPGFAGLIPPGQSEADETPAGGTPAPDSELQPPLPLESLNTETAKTSWTTNVSWALTPTIKTDTRFDTTTVLLPSDPSWKVLTSRWIGSYDGKLSLSTGLSNGFWTLSDDWSLRQQIQDTWYLGASVTESDKTTYDTQDDQQTTSLLSQTLGSTLKPFVAGGAWRESNLKYALTTKLWEDTATVSRTFDGTADSVTAHQTSAEGIWYLWEGTPTLKLQAGWQTTLAPLDPLRTYTGSMSLQYPWGRATTKISAKETDTVWTNDPWESVLEWTPWNQISLKETFQYELDETRPLSSTTIATVWGFSAQYQHLRTTPYRFDVSGSTPNWVVAGDTDFVPSELRFGYALDLPAYRWWYDRNALSAKVNFSWPINLQKYSQMPLTLSYTVNYKLYRFLDLQITEGIQNKTAYRYFPALAESLNLQPVDFLTDLWSALAVWDQEAIRRTSFKMTNLSVALVHYLDDWQVKLDYSGAPQLNTAGTQYDWVGTLTLLVQWFPVPELKTQMNWDKEGVLTIAKNSS